MNYVNEDTFATSADMPGPKIEKNQ